MHEMQKQQRRFMIDSPDRCVSPSENCASLYLSQTIKRENTDVFSLLGEVCLIWTCSIGRGWRPRQPVCAVVFRGDNGGKRFCVMPDI